MDKESLVRICKSAFSGEDIVEAKDLLFGCTSRAKVTRRGQGKEPRDLEDMICLFNAMTGSKQLPTFVARELHKLPPTTFDHVDVTRLLRDIVAVQADLRQIQEKYAADITQYVTISDFEQLKAELDLLKVSSVPPGVKTGNNAPFVNMHRGAFCAGDSWEQVCDSGPIGLAHIDANRSLTPESCAIKPVRAASVEVARAPPSLSYAQTVQHAPVSLTQSPEVASKERNMNMGRVEVGHMSTDARADKQLISMTQRSTSNHNDLTTPPRISDNEEGGGEWVQVERRRRRTPSRYTGRQGKAVLNESSKFKAAETKIPLYIYNVSKETNAEHIAEYILEKTNINIVPYKMVMRGSKTYDSYKIYVPKSKLYLFEDDEFWPYDIYFRRYFFTGAKKDNNNMMNLETNNPTKNGARQNLQ
ncbi:hypothetical protein JYU34_012345 [Plutella xylostella]|uniref:Mutant cadherin n=1 Tax=Plutella xylostella TaxID=51655 RepID=A0ABQ7QB30_PLUXY|nr:hypothetical protein JYU34_012345 [Plutella xylostella]